MKHEHYSPLKKNNIIAGNVTVQVPMAGNPNQIEKVIRLFDKRLQNKQVADPTFVACSNVIEMGVSLCWSQQRNLLDLEIALKYNEEVGRVVKL